MFRNLNTRHITEKVFPKLRLYSNVSTKPACKENDPEPPETTKNTAGSRTPTVSNINKMKFCTLDTGGPISRVAMCFSAGSRNETPFFEGITHFVRRCAGLKSQHGTEFLLTRCMQQYGGNIYCAADREIITFIVTIQRRYVERALMHLQQAVLKPLYRPWEVKDRQQVIKADIAGRSDECRLFDMLHRAAYRTGLGNSLYCPWHKVNDFLDPDHLLCYHSLMFQPERASMVGINVDGRAVKQFTAHIEFGASNDAAGKIELSKFHSGELRQGSRSPFANVAIAREGAPACDLKAALTFSLLREIWGSGSNVAHTLKPSGQLMAIAKAVTSDPVIINTFSLSYSDSGLFGINVVTKPGCIEKVLKAIVEGINKMALKEIALENAKTSLLATVFYTMDSNRMLIEEIAGQSLYLGRVFGCEEISKMMKEISLKDVEALHTKVWKEKLAMAAFGNIGNVPYLDKVI